MAGLDCSPTPALLDFVTATRPRVNRATSTCQPCHVTSDRTYSTGCSLSLMLLSLITLSLRTSEAPELPVSDERHVLRDW